MRLVRQVEEQWAPFRAAIERCDPACLEQETGSGWTRKEMLAHVAFWDEAVAGVVIGMFRGLSMPGGWQFGSGYSPEPGVWPSATVHNEREATWARSQSVASVLQRVLAAHTGVSELLATVTDAEAEARADYFGQLGEHYVHHLPDLTQTG